MATVLADESYLLEVHVSEAGVVSSFLPGISILPRYCSACNHMPQMVPILFVELSHAQKPNAADSVVSSHAVPGPCSKVQTKAKHCSQA
jgi:hypothetical protein